MLDFDDWNHNNMARGKSLWARQRHASVFGVLCLWRVSQTLGFAPTLSAVGRPRPRVRVCRLQQQQQQQQLGITDNESDDSSPAQAAVPLPPTPCIRICRYNRDFYNGQVCIGCFREAFEIAEWVHLDNQGRLYALEDALERCDTATTRFEGAISRDELQAQIMAYQIRVD